MYCLWIFILDTSILSRISDSLLHNTRCSYIQFKQIESFFLIFPQEFSFKSNRLNNFDLFAIIEFSSFFPFFLSIFIFLPLFGMEKIFSFFLKKFFLYEFYWKAPEAHEEVDFLSLEFFTANWNVYFLFQCIKYKTKRVKYLYILFLFYQSRYVTRGTTWVKNVVNRQWLDFKDLEGVWQKNL